MSQILVCDYCKSQTDKSKLTRILFKEGKKELSRYDICEGCFAKLTIILDAKFVGKNPQDNNRGIQPCETTPALSKDLVQSIEDGDIDPEDLTQAKPDNHAQRTHQENRMTGGPDTLVSTDDAGKCLHINKTPIVFGKGVKVPYRQCKDCSKKIYVKKVAERGLDMSVPEGVRVKDETK